MQAEGHPPARPADDAFRARAYLEEHVVAELVGEVDAEDLEPHHRDERAVAVRVRRLLREVAERGVVERLDAHLRERGLARRVADLAGERA